jgi:signal transduction histidine kinase
MLNMRDFQIKNHCGMKLKGMSIFFILIVVSLMSTAQVKRSALVGAYVYNFARYTTWANENRYEDFSIALIGNDKEIIDEILSFSKTKELKGKPIVVEKIDKIPRVLKAGIRMVVLLNDEAFNLGEVVKLIEGKNIVLVSDRIADKDKVMFNLFDTPNSGLSFEINRANIINQGISIDPEIILLGGTVIDVAALYRTSQKSMDTLHERLNLMNDSLATLKGEVSQTLDIIQKQRQSIDSQTRLLDNHELEIKLDKLEIDKQKTEVNRQLELINQQEILLKTQKTSINEHQIELDEQRSFIENQLSEIRRSKTILDSLNAEIEKQHKELGLKGDIIERQKITTWLAIATVILSIIILFILVKRYLEKNEKNKLLIQQKDQIVKINQKLELTNKSLYGTITKLHETQSQLLTSEKMASLGVLTAGIAHEINNPVNFIYTGINSLNKDMDELMKTLAKIIKQVEDKGSEELIKEVSELKKESDLDEVLEIIPQTIIDIKVGAERAADIIKGLRNFSRLDRDSMQLSNIHEGIDSSLLLLRNKFKNHISVKKEFGQIPAIECYPGKLNQAFLNIISNAIDAIEKEGVITIRTWNDDEKVFIQIEDTGKGINEEDISKIFDPFFTTKSVGKGVGLGLSITYGIIHEHHGKIDVKSELNSGTQFTISLPCKTYN